MRGGATKTKNKTKLDRTDAAVLFALANTAVYAVLYQGMVLYGGITFITVLCWGVWGLWSLTSSSYKTILSRAIRNPEESLTALASVLLNSTSLKTPIRRGGEKEAGPFLEDGDIEKQKAGRGESCTFPTSMLLTGCDNGLDWNQISKGEGFWFRLGLLLGLRRRFRFKRLVNCRSDMVTLEFVEDATYIEQMQLTNEYPVAGTNEKEQDDNSLVSLLFDNEDYHKIFVRQGEAFTFPSKMILVECDNGLGRLKLGDVEAYGQLRKRSQGVTLHFVREKMYCERLQEWADEKMAMPQGITIALNQLEGLLEQNFLSPSLWPKLLSRPLALFGSAFSHMDVDHILANLGTLHMIRETEHWLGTRMFAHLYLTSSLLSHYFRCTWQNSRGRGRGELFEANRESLGASGAISGVLAWWSIECAKRGSNLEFNGKTIPPLWFWMLYVAIDMSGLLQLGKLQAIFAAGLLEEELGAGTKDKEDEEEEEEKKSKPKGPIGCDAHVGGALAAVLWHTIPLVKKRLLFLRESL